AFGDIMEQLVHGNHVAFHAHDFRNIRHAAHTVAHAAHLHREVHGRGYLRTNGTAGDIQARHTDHVFKTRHRVARMIGVNGGKRTFMARVHGLHHVERFGATHLTHDNTVGAHTQ